MNGARSLAEKEQI